MAVQINRIPVTMFDEFVNKAENAGRLFEYIQGEIVEVPSNPFVSELAARLIFLLSLFLEDHDIGHVTGEAGGYMVSGERYAPDVAFISYAKQPELAKSGYNPNPPDIAIEIISNTSSREEQNQLRMKLTSYLAAGVIVLVVDGDARTVELHKSTKHPKKSSGDDIIEIPEHLPGFQLKVSEIFAKLKS